MVKKEEVSKVFRSPRSSGSKKRDFKFDNFEVVYKLGDEVVGRYMTSPSIRGFFTGKRKTIQYNLTWAEREELDHKIADLICKEHYRLVARKK